MALSLGTTSYAFAALAFLALSVLLASIWRSRSQAMPLALACLVSTIWAAAAAYVPSRTYPTVTAVDILEVARGATWFVFLTLLLGKTGTNAAFLRNAAVGSVAISVSVVALKFLLNLEPTTWLNAIAALSNLLLAMVGIVMVEHLYRSLGQQHRWETKFLCVGLGSMYVYDFFLYSDALLFQRVNADIWAARGFVNAMVAALLAVAIARNPRWSIDVVLSHRMAFHTTAIFGAATYLLIMAATGYYISIFGGNWGPVIQVTFLFGALLLLAAILLSGSLRAQVKVFLSKHFFSYHYDYREEWLRITQTLSEGKPGAQLYVRSIEAIAELVESVGGSLWLSREGKQFEEVASWKMPSIKQKEPGDGSLSQFLEQRQWVVSLDQYENEPSRYEGLVIPQWLRSLEQAWLVVPLILHEQVTGFVVLARSRGQIKLNWEVSDVLKTAGRQAASYLAQLEATKALLVARQFESLNRMTAFLIHDLKNLVAMNSLLLSNAEKHKQDPAFQDDMIETVSESVEKMNRLLLELQRGHSSHPPEPVLLEYLVQRAVTAKSGLKPAPTLEVYESATEVVAHAARLERVIGHLIQNAIEATPPEGTVEVSLSQQHSAAIVTISDTGCGMSDEFVRDQLFAPFESTKSTGMGIGTYEAKEYVNELGGRIDVHSRQSEGTTFKVTLPVYGQKFLSQENADNESAEAKSHQ